MGFPREPVEPSRENRRTGIALMRRLTIDGAMEALSVVIIPEFLKLPLQVRDIPEQRLIGILTPDRPNQAFNVGIGKGACREWA